MRRAEPHREPAPSSLGGPVRGETTCLYVEAPRGSARDETRGREVSTVRQVEKKVKKLSLRGVVKASRSAMKVAK